MDELHPSFQNARPQKAGSLDTRFQRFLSSTEEPRNDTGVKAPIPVRHDRACVSICRAGEAGQKRPTSGQIAKKNDFGTFHVRDELHQNSKNQQKHTKAPCRGCFRMLHIRTFYEGQNRSEAFGYFWGEPEISTTELVLAESPMGMLNAVAPWNMELMSSTFEVSHALMFSLKLSKSLNKPLLRAKMQLHLRGLEYLGVQTGQSQTPSKLSDFIMIFLFVTCC